MTTGSCCCLPWVGKSFAGSSAAWNDSVFDSIEHGQ